MEKCPECNAPELYLILAPDGSIIAAYPTVAEADEIAGEIEETSGDADYQLLVTDLYKNPIKN